MLAVVAVSADYRSDDFGFRAECLLKSEAGSDYALAYFGLMVGLLFSAYIGEELVDVMYNSDGHVSYLPIPTRSRAC